MIALATFLALVPLTTGADDTVPVQGSNVRFPVLVQFPDNGQSVEMGLTGVALRKKLIISVYSMGSYLDKTVKVATPEELATVDAAKWLFLVMERDVSGADMAAALRMGIEQTSPKDFQPEMARLVTFFEKQSVRKGDRVWLAHRPGKGVLINVAGREQIEIANVNFSKAIWNIYLGPTPVAETVKVGLVSRLW